jgi:hypothetical protein
MQHQLVIDIDAAINSGLRRAIWLILYGRDAQLQSDCSIIQELESKLKQIDGK